MKKNINWKNLTSEEIKLRQLELENHYEALKNLTIEILEEMDIIEVEYNEANKELSKRIL